MCCRLELGLQLCLNDGVSTEQFWTFYPQNVPVRALVNWTLKKLPLLGFSLMYEPPRLMRVMSRLSASEVWPTVTVRQEMVGPFGYFERAVDR